MSAVYLEAAVRAAALILLVWAALALCRIRNPHRLKALWTGVLIASLGMPLLMQMHMAPAVAAPMLRWTIRPGGDELIQARSLRALSIVMYGVPFVLLWRHALAWARLWRIRRRGRMPSGPWAEGHDVRVSERIASPATFGTTILLPEECSSWSRLKLTAVMAHECAHVLHRDCYVLWLARLHASIFWFNPLAWWLVRQLAALAEQTSDEAAVATLGNGADYAEILLGLRMSRAGGLATAMASSGLPARIDRILAGTTLSPALKRPQLFLMIAALLPAVALAAAPLRPSPTAGAADTQPSAAVSGAESLEPKVVSWGPIASYYPREAMDQGIDGTVDLAITLDSAGRPTDTQILREYPLNMGFGAAASAVAHVTRYSNPTGRPVTFTVRFVFALRNAEGDQGPAD